MMFDMYLYHSAAREDSAGGLAPLLPWPGSQWDAAHHHSPQLISWRVVSSSCTPKVQLQHCLHQAPGTSWGAEQGLSSSSARELAPLLQTRII